MKKLIAGMGAGLLALGFAGTALAATVTDGSTLTYTRLQAINFAIHNTSNATITNSVSSNSNTGGNAIVAGDDIRGVTVRTGNADSGAAVINEANNSEVNVDASIDGSGVPTDLGLGNSTTSDDSAVTVSDKQTIDQDVTNDQTANASNSVAAASNTGNNTVVSGDNLEDATLTTGIGTSATIVTNSFNNIAMRIFHRIVR